MHWETILPPYESCFFQSYVHCCLVAKSWPTLLRPHGLQPTSLLCPRDFPGKNVGGGCYFLLQGGLPNLGIKSKSPALGGGFFTIEPPGKPSCMHACHLTLFYKILNMALWWQNTYCFYLLNVHGQFVFLINFQSGWETFGFSWHRW